MAAELKPRITTEGRTFLPDAIPLSTPYLVFLDPSDLCNAKCPWCPTGSNEIRKYRKQQFMDLDLYRKIIDDLVAMPEPIKVLRLYLFGEPLLNPLFPEMVAYAKKTGRFGQVDATSNGLLLRPILTQRIINAGLDKIFFSVPIDYDQYYVEHVAYFHGFAFGRGTCKVHVKTIGGNPDHEKQFHEDFRDISDSLSIEHISPCWPEYEVKGDSVGIYGQALPEKEPQVCSYLFYSLAINADGTVSACFLDWPKKLVIGDLKEQSFSEIWNGRPLKRIRKLHTRGERATVPMCRDCKQLKYGMADNIDAYVKEILEKL